MGRVLIRTALLCGGLAFLTACGGGSDDAAATSEADTGEGASVAAEAAPEAAPSGSGFSSGVEMFGENTRAYSELQTINLFDVKIGMSPDQVRTILLEKGFAEPAAQTDRIFSSASRYAIDCAPGQDDDPCQQVAFIQAAGLEWTRGENGEEKVVPLFFVDRNLDQKLYALDYERTYDPAIDPVNIAADMKQRFGEPTEEQEFRGTLIDYAIRMEVPEGFSPAPEAQQQNARRSILRHVEDTRDTCLKQEVDNFPEPRTEVCERLFAAPAQPQQIFTAMFDRYTLKGTFTDTRYADNEVLKMKITPTTLNITLNGAFLAIAETLIEDEDKLLARLAELQARRDNDVGISSDL